MGYIINEVARLIDLGGGWDCLNSLKLTIIREYPEIRQFLHRKDNCIDLLNFLTSKEESDIFYEEDIYHDSVTKEDEDWGYYWDCDHVEDCNTLRGKNEDEVYYSKDIKGRHGKRCRKA